MKIYPDDTLTEDDFKKINQTLDPQGTGKVQEQAFMDVMVGDDQSSNRGSEAKASHQQDGFTSEKLLQLNMLVENLKVKIPNAKSNQAQF